MTGFVGNANDGSKYVIFEFTEAGEPLRPVSQSSLSGAAWPSAVKISGNTYVYGSVLSSGAWSSIHRWSSIAGAAYTDNGAVLTANASEPYGIGPATLNFDGTTYRLFYLIRGAGGAGGSVGLATSTDGTTFTRQGIVYSAGSEAPGGLSVSFALTVSGVSYLLLHAYSADLQTAWGIVVSASDPNGPYAYLGTTVEPSGVCGTATGSAGNNFAAFTGSGFSEGGIVVIKTGAATSQPYTVKEILNGVMWFDHPLGCSPSGAIIADIMKSKADLSYARQLDDGSFEGGVTGYGALPGITAEYTVKATAPAITGPWTIGGDYVLVPYFASGAFSTENPEPIIVMNPI